MAKKLSIKIWILIIALALSVLAIRPTFESGALIKSVDSSLVDSGIKSGEIIKFVNSNQIKTLEDYSSLMNQLFPSTNLIKLTIQTKSSQYILYTNETPRITIGKIPHTRIKMGLDLQGGARAIVRADKPLSSSDLQDLISVTRNRLNVYGLSDVSLRAISDLSGNNYMLIEVAGATPKDLEELISKQGKFEAKIGNKTVFVGGHEDITSVCRNDASCAGIEQCTTNSGQDICTFRFVVYLSEAAAKRHAAITANLGVNYTEYGTYLDKKLDLYLDDKLVDSLLISEGLKGQETTVIQIQGSGAGADRNSAIENANEEMKQLQTVLITGSLPYKLEIVKLDTISPTLGEKFVYYLFFAGLVAFIAVSLIIFIRYRKVKSSLALLLTSFSEVLIILGIASLINWNLDLPSIAGILATIGTGVDQQIVILDESHLGKLTSIKERLKRALFIIVSAYFTSLASLMPLFWAGGGLLKGFAITTLIGITSGVLITRPAFADIIKRIEG
ncbi:preprotein translocase subunit SecD [Candidatus Woesearchaeota archaeon CG10_big_fil_rev_8_21_14_0_10_34_12]|nr:MAG: preprotein translocase subunit SecD [Candidatus Woesearchaeota archaeon CG10_big_fil_rev_8_21_14_0_10_34_12]